MLTVTSFNPLKISPNNLAAGGQLVHLFLCYAPIRTHDRILVFVLTIAVLVFPVCHL
jgi:hypothetical protein